MKKTGLGFTTPTQIYSKRPKGLFFNAGLAVFSGFINAGLWLQALLMCRPFSFSAGYSCGRAGDITSECWAQPSPTSL